MTPLHACWLAFAFAFVAGCVSEPSAPPITETGPWRFDEGTLGTTVTETQDPSQPTGTNPVLTSDRLILLPGQRIRRPDGSVERYYPFPAGLRPHYKAMISNYCEIFVGKDHRKVPFVDKPDDWDKAHGEGRRAILLRDVKSPDVVWTGPKIDGVFGQFPGGFGTINPPVFEWLAARGHPDDIDALEGFIEIFLIGVDQIEIAALVVESAVSDVTDIGSLTSLIPNNGKGLLKSLTTNFPSSAANSGILSFKGIQSKTELDTTLQMLQQRSEIKFLSTPRIVLRNGGSAALVKGDRVPIQNVTAITPSGNFSTAIRYEEVGLQLRISAFAVGRDAIFLNVQVQNGNISGFTSIGGLTNPQITNRSASTSVILKQGQSLTVGGLISKSTEERVTRLPLLGDIPLLGTLFRSTFDSTVYGEVNFMFTPSIVRSQFDVDLPRVQKESLLENLADEFSRFTGIGGN